MTKTKDPICRSFRQDFPQFVARAEALGVTISLSKSRRGYGRERVFWLDGYKQLTGYTTRSDGSPFTLDDAAANIDTALTAIENDRDTVATLRKTNDKNVGRTKRGTQNAGAHARPRHHPTARTRQNLQRDRKDHRAVRLAVPRPRTPAHPAHQLPQKLPAHKKLGRIRPRGVRGKTPRQPQLGAQTPQRHILLLLTR
jgi:hypothetical protein